MYALPLSFSLHTHAWAQMTNIAIITATTTIVTITTIITTIRKDGRMGEGAL